MNRQVGNQSIEQSPQPPFVKGGRQGADHRLDTLGLFCPLPIILTEKQMKTMQIGEVLEVLSDDPGIKTDMPIWCRQSENEWITQVEEGTQITCYVRKKK